MTEPKNYLSPQENLKQHYKSQAQKGANAVRSGREEFAKDYIEPTAKMAGSFSPLGPMIGIMDAFNAYKKGDTAGAVIGAGLEALPYGLSKAKTITNFLKPAKKFTGYHASMEPVEVFKERFPENYFAKHGGTDRAIFFTDKIPEEQSFLSKRPYLGKYEIKMKRPYIKDFSTPTEGGTSRWAESINFAERHGYDGAIIKGIRDNQMDNSTIYVSLNPKKVSHKDWIKQPKINSKQKREENTLDILSSLSKLFPKKFVPNPEAYYRMIGDVEGVDDAIKSGVIRPNQTGIFSNRKAYYTKGKPNDVNNPIINDGVKKGTYYKGPYMIEVSPGEYFPIRETNLPQWEFGITKPGEHIPINADNVKIYKQHWLRGYKEIPKKQKGGNIDLYNRLNPGGGFPNWDPRRFFNLGSVIDNGILYTFGGGKSRKGTNLATPEEEAYWKKYLGLPQDLIKPTDVRINADKGDNTSEFVGMPDSMLERIAAIADTTNTGKMLRNFSQYEEKLKPTNKLGLEKIYNFGKQLLNNPGKGQQAHETLSLKTSDNGKTGLGALQSFGMVWDKDKKVIKAYDTYDFPDYLNMFIPKRDKTLKIRGEIKFDPVKGSKILNDKDYRVKNLKN